MSSGRSKAQQQRAATVDFYSDDLALGFDETGVSTESAAASPGALRRLGARLATIRRLSCTSTVCMVLIAVLLTVILVVVSVSLARHDIAADARDNAGSAAGCACDELVRAIRSGFAVPPLPADVSVAASTIVVFGDGSVRTAATPWYSTLHSRYVRTSQLVSVAARYASSVDLDAQYAQLANVSPPVRGDVFAFVQIGAEDVLRNGAPAIPAVVARITQFAQKLLASSSTNASNGPGGASASAWRVRRVFVLDYADATTGLAYVDPTQHRCDAPFDTLFNMPSSTGDALVSAFDLLSAALASTSASPSSLSSASPFVYVPVRQVLSRYGFGRQALLVSPRAQLTAHTSTAILRFDAPLPTRNTTPALFADDCFFLNADGNARTAELAWAFLGGATEYFILD